MKSHYLGKSVSAILVVLITMLFASNINAQSCSNVTDGGLVCCDQASNIIPFDPAPLTNVQDASGGSGTLEYVWMSTTDPYNTQFSSWSMVPNSNSASYDPGPLSKTTFFVRCARRSGCADYVRESNVIVITVSPCNNITDPGKIASNQVACGSPWDPMAFISQTAASGGTSTDPVQYAWYKSTVLEPFNTTSGNWKLITGAIAMNYDPTPITQTTYFVRVARRSGCVTWLASNIVSVTMKPAVSASATTIAPVCNGSADGSIKVSVSGGTPPFTYQWNYGQIPANTQNPTNLPAGTYSVTVTDANTCMAMLNVDLKGPNPFAITFNKTDVSCAGASNGTAVVQVTGGTPQYSYLWTNNMTAPQVGGLSPGTYFVTVTDIKGCQKVASVKITEPAPLTITTDVTEVACFGGNNGGASVNVSGGTAPYSYYWSNGATTSSVSNLSAGIYTVTVKDAKNCTQTVSVVIKQPNTLNVSIAKTDVKCYGLNNGIVNVTVSGGTPNYTYLWNNGQTTQNLSDVAAGSYSVTVTDSKGCTKVASINVVQPDAIVLNTNTSNAKCKGNSDGTASVTVSGGTSPYSFIWDNGKTTSSISGLAEGSYSVTVTDNNGCTKSTTVTIGAPTALSLTTSGANLKCGGGTDATISVSVSGGTSPYAYLWSNGSTTASISGIGAGTYTVTVTDANGCTAKASATVTEPAKLQVTIIGTDPTCHNATDGSAEASASGGTSPYTFAWSNGQSGDKITGLSAGTYTVTATDANGCTKSAIVVLDDPAAILLSGTVIDNTCNGENKGSITLAVSGGVTPYTYKWSNNATTQNLSGLVAGTYSVTVTDAKGCTSSKSFELKHPTKLVVQTKSSNITCKGANDGAISLTVSGGTSPYSATWSNGSTGLSINKLNAGIYTATITDANGCTAQAVAEVTEPGELVIDITTQDEKCNKQNNGAAAASVTGGTTPYKYKWSNGSVLAAITNVAAGTYTVTVTDQNGCSKTASATIKAASEISVSSKVTDVKCYGAQTGSVSINVSGGTVPYTYLWSNGATTSDLNNVGAGTYSVVITDANGCTKTISATVSQPTNPLTLTPSFTPSSCNGGTGSATVTVTGGTAPYAYLWSNGATTNRISNATAGIYSVTVTDDSGCTKTTTITITQPTPLFLSVSGTNLACNGDKNGTATVSVTGGVAPYTYKWSNGASTSFINNLVAGTYTVTVTDVNGCQETANVSVTQPAAIQVDVTGASIKCFGTKTGTVTATWVSGGTAPFGYKWSNGVAGNTQSGLAAGTYTVTITDANGCTASGTAEVNSPAKLVITTASTPTRCKGGTDGTATISATGGTGAYTYLWSNGATSATITGLGADTYSVTVTDSNGCSEVTNVKVSEPFGYKLQVYTTSINCYNGNNGSAKAIITGAPAGIVQVAWSTGETGVIIGGLSAGTYSVTTTDQNGCTATAGFSLSNPDKLEFVLNSSDIKCNGTNSGTASVSNINGGTAPYAFSWSNNRTTQSISNLAPGTYSVTVTDAKGCADSKSVTIVQPTAIVCQANVTSNVTTYNGTQGAATATASGGTLPYTFKWSNGATTASIGNLAAGTYSVTVTDANGCFCTSTISLVNKSKLGNYTWQDLNGDGIQQSNEPGLANVTVTLSGNMTDGTPVSAVQVTDTDGMYMFDGLMAGTYKVTFEQPNGWVITTNNAGNDTEDSDVNPTTKMTGNYTLGNGESNMTVDAGYFKLVKLGDRVWFDKNKNGLQDAGEAGFANIMVKLIKAGPDNVFKTSDDVVVQSTITDNTGMYMFADVMPGMKYQVEFMKSSIPAGYEITTKDAGDDTKDSDADADGRSHIIMVMFNQQNDFTIDAGLYIPCNNVVDGGLVAPKEQVLCGPGIAATITNIDPATGGGTAPIEYLWMKSTTNPIFTPNSSDWMMIPGSNSPSYSPGFVSVTTYYVRCARRQGCEPYSAESNVVAVIVNSIPTAIIATHPTTDVCALSMVDFVAEDAGTGATYSWNFGANAVPQFATGKNATIMYNAAGQKTVTLTVTKGGCTASTSVTVNVIACPGVSPKVAIINFTTVVEDNKKINLSWESTRPLFDNVFVVERSKNGATYTAIATINASDLGNTGEYTFVDNQPALGNNYYRIKHVDYIGGYVFSKTAFENINTPDAKVVTVYPNPFTDKVNVELSRVTAQSATIQVVNNFGQIVMTESIPSGQARKEIDMSFLDAGFYIIRIDFEGKTSEIHKVTRHNK